MLTLGFFVFPDFSILDVAGPLAAFDVPRREIRPPPYDIVVCSKDGGPVVSACGASMNTVPIAGRRFDTFVISGGPRALEASEDRPPINHVRPAAKNARRLASVWTGAL